MFDVSEDWVVSAPVVAGEGHDEPAAPRVRRRLTRAQVLRRLIAAGAALAVGLTSWGVTAAVDRHERAQRLASAPGGVLDLSHPLETTWEAEADSGLLFAPELVVVRRGTALHGLDARTGDERWQVEVGGDPVCDTSTWMLPGIGRAQDPIVCVDRTGQSVTAIHPDGTFARRELPSGLEEALPATDGGLLTMTLAGPFRTSDVRVEQNELGAYQVVGEMPSDGPDAVLRLEDAATGEARWERTVAYRPLDDVMSCGAWIVDPEDPDGLPRLDVYRTTFTVDRSFVSLSSCFWNALLGGDGALLASGARATWGTWPVAEGGFVEYFSEGPYNRTRLRAPDGTLVATFDGTFQQPLATDGTGRDVRLIGAYDEPLRRVTDAGETLWTAEDSVQNVLVRAAGVVVVVRAVDRTLAGIDLASGETLWTRAGTPSSERPWYETSGSVQAAFTDGTLGLVVYDEVTMDGGPQAQMYAEHPTHLVAFDLRTGEVRWEADRAEGEISRLYAAEGRLVEFVPGPSTVEDGTVVSPATVTVRALR